MKCPYQDCMYKNRDWDDFDSVDGKRIIPKENDVGICYTCGGWWQIVNGVAEMYTPTKEELEAAMKAMPKTRQRSYIEFKARRGIKGLKYNDKRNHP